MPPSLIELIELRLAPAEALGPAAFRMIKRDSVIAASEVQTFSLWESKLRTIRGSKTILGITALLEQLPRFDRVGSVAGLTRCTFTVGKYETSVMKIILPAKTNNRWWKAWFF
jgi:hypothetical protein